MMLYRIICLVLVIFADVYPAVISLANCIIWIFEQREAVMQEQRMCFEHSVSFRHLLHLSAIWQKQLFPL